MFSSVPLLSIKCHQCSKSNVIECQSNTLKIVGNAPENGRSRLKRLSEMCLQVVGNELEYFSNIQERIQENHTWKSKANIRRIHFLRTQNFLNIAESYGCYRRRYIRRSCFREFRYFLIFNPISMWLGRRISNLCPSRKYSIALLSHMINTLVRSEKRKTASNLASCY